MRNFLKGILVGVVITCIITLSFNALAQSVMKTIDVALNAVNLKVNGKPVTADNFIYEGRTYVQLRQVSEMLDKEILWDGDTYTVQINDKKSSVNQLPSKDIEDIKKAAEQQVNKEYKVFVNGIEIALEVPVVKSGEDFLVFYKALPASMDIENTFDFERQTLTFKSIDSSKLLVMKVDKKQYTFNVIQGELKLAPTLANNRYCIPLKQFVEIFGGTVSIDESTKVINVTYTSARNLKQLVGIDTIIKVDNDLYLYSYNLSKSAAIARDNELYIHPEYLDGLLSLNYNNYTIDKVDNAKYKGRITPTKSLKYLAYNIKDMGTSNMSSDGYLVNDDLSKNYYFRIKNNDDIKIVRDKDNNPYMPISELFKEFGIKFTSEYKEDSKSLIISFENLRINK